MNPNQSGTFEFSSYSEILSILIRDFLLPLNGLAKTAAQDEKAQRIQSSGKILLTIVRNALRSNGPDDRYRKVRIANKKIQSLVMTVPFAVDLLTAVGFVYVEVDGEQHLMFSENHDGYEPGHFVSMANLFCSMMDEELKKFEASSMSAEIAATANGTSKISMTKTKNNEVFLSEEERKVRSIKAKAIRRAKRAEKEEAMKRWEEDQQERFEKKTANQKDHLHQRETEFGALPKPSSNSAKASRDRAESIGTLGAIRANAAVAWKMKRKESQHPNPENSKEKIDSVTPRELPVDDLGKGSLPPQGPLAASLDRKPPPAAIIPTPKLLEEECTSQPTKPLSSWDENLKLIPRCASARGIRETSLFYEKKGSRLPSSNTRTCLKRLFSEFEVLKTSLPAYKECSAWLRFDEEMPQYVRALLTAPLPGPSPYSGGVFAFDMYFPENYPEVPPKCKIITTGRGKVRFGPNLYACGIVCLSILGTWPGPKWNPKKSSIFQLLVSIQSLLLGCEHPYYLEPGHGGWEDKIKEGDFATVGQTLSGKTVKEELKLPSKVWSYEDKIRVASVRYAMLEPLEVLVGENNGTVESLQSMNSDLAYLRPFKGAIRLHFTENAAEVLEVVREWIDANRPSVMGSEVLTSPLANPITDALDLRWNQRKEPPRRPYPSEFVDSLSTLNTELEKRLKKLQWSSSVLLPQHDGKTLAENSNPTHSASDCSPVESQQMNGPSMFSIRNDNLKNTLIARMKTAAMEGNYILAGKLQSDLNALQGTTTPTKNGTSSTFEPHPFSPVAKEQQELPPYNLGAIIPDVPSHFVVGGDYDGDDDDDDDDSDRYSYSDWSEYDDEDFGATHTGSRWSQFGTGYKLNDDAGVMKQPATVAEPIVNEPQVPRLSVEDPRKIRIRLPNSVLVTEEFDSNEKLSVLYKVVNNRMLVEGTHQRSEKDCNDWISKRVPVRVLLDAQQKQRVVLSGGAFASPISEYRFTLLSAYPKREYSFEMDGTKSLKDLNIASSATLTVMMCNERGKVKGGLLENKLAEAQGDAMNVDDLGYEALNELGERIGVVVPGDSEWKGIDQNTLDQVSTVLSPKEYLGQKSDGEEDKEDRKCCICLGDFDPTSTDPQLRVLNNCSHVFHSACLVTWLSTKTSCPICKQSLTSD